MALGDKVKQSSMLLMLEVAGNAFAPVLEINEPPALSASAAVAIHSVAFGAPAAGSFAAMDDIDCDLLMLGAGPSGYSAAFRAADLGLKVILVERYVELGGGFIGLEMGTVHSTLGARLDVE